MLPKHDLFMPQPVVVTFPLTKPFDIRPVKFDVFPLANAIFTGRNKIKLTTAVNE